MPRRGDNIYKRKDGRWEGRVRTQTSGVEKGRYKSLYGKTYKEVKRKVDSYKQTKTEPENGCGMDMREAAEIWLKEGKKRWKPTTYRMYAQVVNKYVVPGLGDRKIDKIDNRLLEKFYLQLDGGKDTVLSGNYRFYICAFVRRIMIYIQKKYGYELSIPLASGSLSRQKKIELPGEQALAGLEKYLLENKGEDTCLGIAIALYTGIRIGELCALTWEDIDLEEGVIHIRRNIQRVKAADGRKKTEVVILTPKTSDSVREIPIPPVLSLWLQESGRTKSGYVISGVKNGWTDPRTLQYRFRRILEKCGIEYFNFHMLRHAFATRCVSMGFDVKSLSEILGHSNVKITMSLYVHPTIQQKKQLMDKFIPYAVLDCPMAN